MCLNDSDRYSKTCFKRPNKGRPKIGFLDRLPFNAGQKYCRMLQEEHSAIFFRPPLSYHFPLRPLLCLYLSGCLRQVLLHGKLYFFFFTFSKSVKTHMGSCILQYLICAVTVCQFNVNAPTYSCTVKQGLRRRMSYAKLKFLYKLPIT